MSFERMAGSSEQDKWNERGRKETGDFAATVIRGDLDPDHAHQMQRDNSGQVIQMNGVEEGGWIVSTPAGNRNFDNLAALKEWAGKTGGLVSDLEGNPLAGESVDSILERRAELERFDAESK